MDRELIYVIEKEEHDRESLIRILKDHPEIRFVSLAGVDLIGHETEEKIPVSVFLKDISSYLDGTAAQTDGSSVYLPGIATINNAKIDMKVDKGSRWIIDYNPDLRCDVSEKPVGTLKIPCFLYHEGRPVDSRSILKNAMDHFEEELFLFLEQLTYQIKHPQTLPDSLRANPDYDRCQGRW